MGLVGTTVGSGLGYTTVGFGLGGMTVGFGLGGISVGLGIIVKVGVRDTGHIQMFLSDTSVYLCFNIILFWFMLPPQAYKKY